MFLLP